MRAHLNPVALLASLIGIFSLAPLPFMMPHWFVFKANRLVEGVLHGADLVGMPSKVLLLVWVVLLALSLWRMKGRAWLFAGLATLALWLSLQLVASGVGLLSDGLEPRALARARISLQSGVWIQLLAIYVALFAAQQEAVQHGRLRPWQRALMVLPCLAIVGLLIAQGRFAGLGLSRELQSQGADFYAELVRHLALSLSSVLLASLLGIPAAIGAARNTLLERSVLPLAGLLQTLPSLALFGLMLAPLASLGQHLRGWQALGLIALGLVLVALCLGLRAWLAQRNTATWLQRGLPGLALLLGIVPIALLLLLLASLLYALLVSAASGSLAALRPFASVWQAPLAEVGIRGIGSAPALIALTLYALLPIVRNTYTGLKEVPRAAIEAGRGMGMSQGQILRKVELPLALPLIIEGLRASLVLTIGITTVAFLIGAGGLGVFIQRGIDQVVPDLILLGAMPVIGLALLADGLLRVVGYWLTPRGIRHP